MYELKFNIIVAVTFLFIWIATIVWVSMAAGASAKCLYDPSFDRWECCENVIAGETGMQCAVNQKVALLNN